MVDRMQTILCCSTSAHRASLPFGRLDLDNAAAVTRAPPFSGSFPAMAPPVLESEGVDAWFNAALESARMVMAGVLVHCLKTDLFLACQASAAHEHCGA